MRGLVGVVICVLALAGCASQFGTPPGVPTLEPRIMEKQELATATRDNATIGREQKKLRAPEEELVQRSSDIAREGLALARETNDLNLLEQSEKLLAVLHRYLGRKGVIK